MTIDEQEQIQAVVKRLAQSLDLAPEAIRPEVTACYREWDDAPVRDFLPIFVERAVRSRLRERQAASS